MSDRDLDVTHLDRFLDHLEPRNPDAAAFARLLVDRQPGWRVTDLGGPVQMDVWWLKVERGRWSVWFGIERGISDGIIATRGTQGDPDHLRLHLSSRTEAEAWLADPPAYDGNA